MFWLIGVIFKAKVEVFCVSRDPADATPSALASPEWMLSARINLTNHAEGSAAVEPDNIANSHIPPRHSYCFESQYRAAGLDRLNTLPRTNWTVLEVLAAAQVTILGVQLFKPVLRDSMLATHCFKKTHHSSPQTPPCLGVSRASPIQALRAPR